MAYLPQLGTYKMARKNKKIEVQGTEITIFSHAKDEYISVTDIARFKDPKRTDYIIQNWMRNRNTIEFLGIWERLNNPDFKPIEFDGFRNQAGLNSFILTPKQWIEKTNAIGIISKAGRYGGTYAHKDIAFEFATWVSVEFKLYLIKEFQRLKDEEQKQLGWDIRRNLAKINYRIHTDAIKENLIPSILNKSHAFLQSEKPIAKQSAVQLVQIPWGQNVTKNLPDEFRSSLPSIEEIEAELIGAEESQ